MNKDQKLLFSYFLLWQFYELQGALGLQGSLLTRLLVLFLVGLSFVYCLAVHLPDRRGEVSLPFFVVALDLFLILLTLYGVVYMVIGGSTFFAQENVEEFQYLKNLYRVQLPLYVFFYYARKGVLDDSMMKKILAVMLVLASMKFFLNDFLVKETRLLEADAEITNNEGYTFVALIPALFFFDKKNWVQYLLLFYLLTFVLFGMKRGAILIALISTIVFFVLKIKNGTKEERKNLLLLSVMCVVLLSFMVIYLWQNSDYFQLRFRQTMEGSSSGRDYIYATLWNHFLYDTTWNEFLFGLGPNATITVSKSNFAHSDWLELLTNQGLLGVLFFVAIWIAWGRMCWQNRESERMFGVLCILFIICFMKSIFSMFYYSADLSYCCLMGYALGGERNREVSIKEM